MLRLAPPLTAPLLLRPFRFLTRYAGAGAGAPAAQLVQSGLIHEWRFDDGSGQVLTDYVGARDGQLGSTTGADVNDPVWHAAGLSFDGVNDYAIASVPRSNDFHFDLVVANAAVASGAHALLFAIWSSNNTGRPRVYRFASGSNIRYLAGSGSSFVVADGTLAVFDGSPHLAQVNVSAGLLNAWVDGVQDVTDFAVSATITAADDNLRWGFIGSDGAMLGELGWLTYYNRALDATERENNRDVLRTNMASRGVTLP